MKKLPKLTLLTSLILLSMTAANAEPYAGFNVGGTLVSITKNITYEGAATNISDKYAGFRGQLVLGYNFHLENGGNNFSNDVNGRITPPDDFPGRHAMLDDWFFAVEIAGNYNSNNASANESPWFLTYNAVANEQQQYGYDLFFVPKYRATPWLIMFLGVGFSEGRFQASTPSKTSGNLGITGNATTWLAGGSVKAGVEVPIGGGTNFVATYQYTNLQYVKWTRIEPFTGESVTGKYKPVINSVTVGLNFG